MINFLLIMSIFMIIAMMIFIINFFLSMKISDNREKATPFECGFDPMSSARLPFSINFFIMTLLFLIFDIEIILILPITLMLENLNSTSLSTFIFFILVLISSLWAEWAANYIKWIH